MQWHVYPAGIIFLSFLTWREAESKGGGDEMKNLIKKLWDGYDPIARPNHDYANPIVVTIQLHLSFVLGMDSQKQLIFLRAFLKVRWKDEYLQWDPKDYGKINRIHVPQARIWKPDIVLQNTANERHTFGTQDMLVSINSKGRVSWEPPFFMEASCKLDMSKYPFDVNVCPMSISSWVSDNNTMLFKTPAIPIKMNYTVINGEFEISSAGVKKYVYIYSDGCYESVNFNIQLARRPLYIILSVQLPVTLLALLSVVPFIMPPEESGKVDIAMTVLLSFTVFLDTIDQKIPSTSDHICGLVVYISALMVVSFLSVVGNVLVVTVRNWDETAEREAIQSNNVGNNVETNATEGNTTAIHSTRVNDDLWEQDISSYSTDLTKSLVIVTRTPKCHYLLRGTRATKLNRIFLILACFLIVLSIALYSGFYT